MTGLKEEKKLAGKQPLALTPDPDAAEYEKISPASQDRNSARESRQ
jgi:hypothetical protein